MLCPACMQELTRVSLTGSLLRLSCADCEIHFLEVVSEPVDPKDLLNILQQVTRKEHYGGRTQ